MLRVMEMGEGVHRIEGPDGTVVGWIRGRTVAFRGFGDIASALDAASPASAALEKVLRRQYPGWPHYEVARDTLRVVHDGAYEWVSDGTAPIARLIRPGDGPPDDFGLEFALPSYASEGVAIAAAHGLYIALAGHLDTIAADDAAPGGAPAAHAATA